MAQILKLPAQSPKLGFKRVRRRAKLAENPDQLDLFASSTASAQIIDFAFSALSPFEQALLWDERGDARAAEFYAKAIEQQDCVADAFCNLGILESQAGNTMRAFDCFTACLKHDPRHSEAHYNLGNLYFDQNDFRLAQLHFQMAAELDPSFANARFNLALVLAINGDAEAAASALEHYKALVDAADARAAEELLENLRRFVVAAKDIRLGAK